MSKFQLIILGLFVIFIIAGVFAFATFRAGNNGAEQLPAITIWGTFPAAAFNNYVSNVSLSLPSQLNISYSQKSPSSFSQEFIAALARGTGPDAILIPADMLLPHLDKITPIPYSVLPERTFKDAYIQEGEIYLSQNGAYALPLAVDPLVMYWNRDTFSAAGLATYPKYWDDFSALNRKITAKDQKGNLRKTAVAMGDFSNVVNARELLGSLILQSGNPVTAVNGGTVSSSLKSSDLSTPIEFFTQFVDPNGENYSWNRGMPDSKTAFLSQTLSTYFGFASELRDIQAKNPNLNFDVAPLPQYKAGGVKAVYGKMYGFSIVRTSANQNGVYKIISMLTDAKYLPALSQAMYLPSVRRDIIAAGSSDPYIAVFDQQALIAKTWLDADPAQSSGVFGTMANSITSGAKSVRDAINDASDQYDVVLKQAVQ